MFKRGQVLCYDVDFDNAILFAVSVEVWWRGEIFDEGGPIYTHTPLSVSLGDRFYPKQKCEFRVK